MPNERKKNSTLCLSSRIETIISAALVTLFVRIEPNEIWRARVYHLLIHFHLSHLTVSIFMALPAESLNQFAWKFAPFCMGRFLAKRLPYISHYQTKLAPKNIDLIVVSWQNLDLPS